MRRVGRWLVGVALAATPGAIGADAPLADAAERGDRASVVALLAGRAGVDLAQADGSTALHWASRRDDVETARLLIAAGADAKAANRYGVAPLSLACVNGSAAMVDLLLGAGADANGALEGGETPLMTAARTGRPGPVRALLARGAKVDAKERRGQTALHWASAEGHAEVVEILLKAGADFRTPLPSGFTPLAFAARDGRAEVARVLIAAGADVNAPMRPAKPSGRSPSRGTAPLILAVENGHFRLAADLIDLGADPDDRRSGFTPLHVLTWVRKPNRGDDEAGDPAPIGSGDLTSLGLVEVLARRGADVNARLEGGASGRGVLNRAGATPFLLASMKADLPYMKLLVKLGADPKLANRDGCNPLMAAAGVGSLAPEEEAGTEDEAVEAVTFLLGLGLDPDAVDANGETAMHGAAYKNLPRVVRLLAGRGAKVEVWNRPNKHGWTPLAIAEGHRPGNFKPSPETVAALRGVLAGAGASPHAAPLGR